MRFRVLSILNSNHMSSLITLDSPSSSESDEGGFVRTRYISILSCLCMVVLTIYLVSPIDSKSNEYNIVDMWLGFPISISNSFYFFHFKRHCYFWHLYLYQGDVVV